MSCSLLPCTILCSQKHLIATALSSRSRNSAGSAIWQWAFYQLFSLFVWWLLPPPPPFFFFPKAVSKPTAPQSYPRHLPMWAQKNTLWGPIQVVASDSDSAKQLLSLWSHCMEFGGCRAVWAPVLKLVLNFTCVGCDVSSQPGCWSHSIPLLALFKRFYHTFPSDA